MGIYFTILIEIVSELQLLNTSANRFSRREVISQIVKFYTSYAFKSRIFPTCDNKNDQHLQYVLCNPLAVFKYVRRILGELLITDCIDVLIFYFGGGTVLLMLVYDSVLKLTIKIPFFLKYSLLIN